MVLWVSAADQDWDDFLLEFEDEPKPRPSVHCSPTPGNRNVALASCRSRRALGVLSKWWFVFPAGPLRPCRRLLGSWMIRGGVWLIAAVSLVSNALVVLSVFCSPVSTVTPPKLLIGLLALVNGLMGVWSGGLAAVDAWTFGSFWRFETRTRVLLKLFPSGRRLKVSVPQVRGQVGEQLPVSPRRLPVRVCVADRTLPAHPRSAGAVPAEPPAR